MRRFIITLHFIFLTSSIFSTGAFVPNTYIESLIFENSTISFSTGNTTIFLYPEDLPPSQNGKGEYTRCFISRIAKPIGYTDNTYELEVTAQEWVGTSIQAIQFKYIVKKTDFIVFRVAYTNHSLGDFNKSAQFKIVDVSDNNISLQFVKFL